MQRNPEELYELGPAAPGVAGAPMLHYLEGFIDAGTAGRLLAEHLLGAFPHETVARFDTDRLIDYRSRRPLMTYDNSRWESYEPPELALHLLHDQGERPFLLLTGPEPDHEWDLFSRAVLTIASQLEHRSRDQLPRHPGRDAAHPAARRDRARHPRGAAGRPPAAAEPDPGAGQRTALLELRFGEAGRDALGFAVQVPHYLAQAVYPPAALALLGSVTTSTGLDLPDAELREAADRTNEAIERQVEESAEVGELVRALEQQYDTAAESQQAAVDAAAGLLADGEAMPTADELAAQFERFLAENQDRTDPPDH
jgi:PAC2 family.